MTRLRQLLSSVLVASYGALTGGLIGWLGTIWMWGIGLVLGAPGGFILGAIAGWRMPLRDAVILFSGTYGSLAAVNWMTFAFGHHRNVDIFLMPVFIVASTLLWRVAQKHLDAPKRYQLAWLLSAGFVLNAILIAAIRS